MSFLVTLALLVVPVVHFVRDHSVGRPHRFPTPHERRHAAHPLPLRLLVDAAWFAYIAGAVAVGLALR